MQAKEDYKDAHKCEGCGQVHPKGKACPEYRGDNMKNYIRLATRTETKNFEDIRFRLQPETIRLLHAAIGLQTEAGEFADQLKRHIFYGAELDELNLLEEIGDLFWYCAIALDALTSDFDAVQRMNIRKLQQRYPEKFEEGPAIQRDSKAERNVMQEAEKRKASQG